MIKRGTPIPSVKISNFTSGYQANKHPSSYALGMVLVGTCRRQARCLNSQWQITRNICKSHRSLIWQRSDPLTIPPSSLTQSVSPDILANNIQDQMNILNPGSLLLPDDPYYIDHANRPLDIQYHHNLSINIVRLLAAIEARNPVEIWSRFDTIRREQQESLQQLSRLQWSHLVKAFSSNSKNVSSSGDVDSWTKLKAVVEAMKWLGHEPEIADYICMIRAASYNMDLEGVTTIWGEINARGLEKTVHIWNSYIMATCNANPKLWKRRFGLDHEQKHVSEVRGDFKEPQAINDAVSLVSEMASQGVKANIRTYELLIIYLGQAGNVDAIRKILDIWQKGSTSSAEPRASTLVAITHAFGACDCVVEGMAFAEQLRAQFHISMSPGEESLFWKALLRWTFYTSEPYGRTSRGVLPLIWDIIGQSRQVKITSSMYRFRVQHAISNRKFDEAIAQLTAINKSKTIKDPVQLISLILNQTCRAMIKNGDVVGAVQVLNRWAIQSPAFALIRTNLLRYIQDSRKEGIKKRDRKQTEFNDIEERDKIDEQDTGFETLKFQAV